MRNLKVKGTLVRISVVCILLKLLRELLYLAEYEIGGVEVTPEEPPVIRMKRIGLNSCV